jgi:hypothetical protein
MSIGAFQHPESLAIFINNLILQQTDMRNFKGETEGEMRMGRVLLESAQINPGHATVHKFAASILAYFNLCLFQRIISKISSVHPYHRSRVGNIVSVRYTEKVSLC